ncbi:MAG TPA: hypothetical protein VFL83_01015 [Anaeromyxobacter sp.]|nr:hypothetical protein [Anaeromyxobacter sp.]
MTGKLSTALRTVLAVAASAGIFACGGSSDPGTDDSASSVKAIAGWVFTTPLPPRTVFVVAPVQSHEMLAFTLVVTGYRDTRITRMAFQVMGTIPAGSLANYRLVWFADGRRRGAAPPTVLGTNDGTIWAPPSSPIVIRFATPLTLPRNFNGEFALLADVNGGAGTFVTPQLQTVTMDQGAGEVYVTDTCDLPLAGDTFYVK